VGKMIIENHPFQLLRDLLNFSRMPVNNRFPTYLFSLRKNEKNHFYKIYNGINLFIPAKNVFYFQTNLFFMQRNLFFKQKEEILL
jgi:hypothetical protein